MGSSVSDAEMTRFGLSFDDDGFHPFDSDETTWNESWFWDWYDDDGENAGHCRIGCLPNQNRVWLWLYLFREGEWFAVEQPFLDFSLVRRPEIAFDQPGLSFSYSITDPLRAGRLRVQTFARAVSGKQSGRMVAVDIDLEINAVGPPHSMGQSNHEGHASESFDARRFEQPIFAQGSISIDRSSARFEGRGERDHSWGPRYWLIEWSFLVINAPELRLQCVEVRFPDDATIEMGYLHTDHTAELTAVDLKVTRSPDLAGAARGSCAVRTVDGAAFAFTFEAISTHEMDLSHMLGPTGRRSTYRRSLIRAVPDHGGETLIGWLEDHTFPEGTNPGA